MFIDYITLKLVNMAAGLVLLAAFMIWGLGESPRRGWAAGLGIIGLVGLILGVHMVTTWPVTEFGAMNLRWANVAYGEMTVLLAATFLAAALAIALGWSLVPTGIFGALAGAVAVWVGVGIMRLGLSATPVLTGVGFWLTGGAGILVLIAVRWPRSKAARGLAALVLLAGAAIWFIVGAMGYWGHLERFSQMP